MNIPDIQKPALLRNMAAAAEKLRQRQKAETVDLERLLGETAADIETVLLKSSIHQPLPVCPYCFTPDDEANDANIVATESAAMLIHCECGNAYLAKPGHVLRWTTQKYPPEQAL